MGQGPTCYIPKFMEIGPLVPKKKILRLFTIYGQGSDGHHYVNIFSFTCTKKLTYKIWSIKVKWFLRKTRFNDFGPKSRNDIDLEYSYTFIYSSSCLHLPMFRSQAAIDSKTSTVFTFYYK